MTAPQKQLTLNAHPVGQARRIMLHNTHVLCCPAALKRGNRLHSRGKNTRLKSQVNSEKNSGKVFEILLTPHIHNI